MLPRISLRLGPQESRDSNVVAFFLFTGEYIFFSRVKQCLKALCDWRVCVDIFRNDVFAPGSRVSFRLCAREIALGRGILLRLSCGYGFFNAGCNSVRFLIFELGF